MVIELLARPGWGALHYALDFITSSLMHSVGPHTRETRSRVWCLVEVSTAPQQLYVPSLPPFLRQAVAEKKILWIKAPEDLVPGIAQKVLESGLCEGVLVRGLEQFSRSTPAAIWGRRWQLAAHKGGTHLFWIHEKAQALIGFDVRLEWTSPRSFEIKKGHGYLNPDRTIRIDEGMSEKSGEKSYEGIGDNSGEQIREQITRGKQQRIKTGLSHHAATRVA